MKGWWLVLKLLRALDHRLARQNAILEEFVDEIRIQAGRRPVYMAHATDDTEFTLRAGGEAFGGTDAEFGRIEFLREHARLSGEIIDDLTDIEAMARAHGWVDREGNITIDGGLA
jgi:hypothetical protein